MPKEIMQLLGAVCTDANYYLFTYEVKTAPHFGKYSQGRTVSQWPATCWGFSTQQAAVNYAKRRAWKTRHYVVVEGASKSVVATDIVAKNPIVLVNHAPALVGELAPF